MISLTFPLSTDLNITDLLQREHPKLGQNTTWPDGVGKIVDFRHLSRRISETVQDTVHVTIDH